MIETLGWISTGLVLLGYIMNARQLVLSFVIISINVYGMYNIKKAEKQ